MIFRFVKEFYDEYAVETFENYDRRKEDIDALIDFCVDLQGSDTH